MNKALLGSFNCLEYNLTGDKMSTHKIDSKQIDPATVATTNFVSNSINEFAGTVNVSSIMRTSGDQTISGTKSFSGKINYTATIDAAANDQQPATTAWCNSASSIVHKTGDETINGNKTFSQTVSGTAMYANWGDLAEMYNTDFNYKEGTLVQFGGEKEMTLAISEANGVISSKPGLLINNNKEDNMQPIALIGKVPVRAVGIVHKFDRITLSDIPGVAKVAKDGDKVIGVALENKLDDDENLVLCSVKLKF